MASWKYLKKKSSESLKSFPEKKRKLNPPNFFLSMRITETSIIKRVDEMQNHIRKELPSLKNRNFTKPSKLHMTLFVMHIKDDQMLQNVMDCLKDSKDVINDHFGSSDSSLSMNGVGDFNQRVIWMGLKDNPIRQILIDCVSKFSSCCFILEVL